MKQWQYNSTNAHDLRVNGQHVLFHVPSTGIFYLDSVSSQLMEHLKANGSVSDVDLHNQFSETIERRELLEVIEEFESLGIVGAKLELKTQSPLKIESYPLNTIVLNVNTGCNLSCTYCYKEDLETAANGSKMALETAKESIDLLLKEGEGQNRINVVFFGGEPLTNLPMIKSAVEYAEMRCAEEGKQVDFSMTTNATMLTEDIVDYLDKHRFGLAVSMDGPKAIHDKNRITTSGNGTYDVVRRKVAMLLSRYRSRPVGARVTLTKGTTDVFAIHQHLKEELGFHEVGFAPVTAGDIASFNLSSEELVEVFTNMKTLGLQYRDAALRGDNNGFSNMHQLMTDLYEGSKKVLPCGAGVGLLAVDTKGDLNLCHRFTGSDLPTFGSVTDGLDKPALGEFLETAASRADKGCETCRIRNLCAGGCYHESYIQYSDPHHPTYHFCDLMRDWIDFGVAVYSEILEKNPTFFDEHVSTRTVTRSHLPAGHAAEFLAGQLLNEQPLGYV